MSSDTTDVDIDELYNILDSLSDVDVEMIISDEISDEIIISDEMISDILWENVTFPKFVNDFGDFLVNLATLTGENLKDEELEILASEINLIDEDMDLSTSEILTLDREILTLDGELLTLDGDFDVSIFD